MRSKVTPAKEKEVIRLHQEESMSFPKIAQQVGLSCSTVQRIWYENNKQDTTQEEEKAILDIYKRGELTPREIARQIGCTTATVRAVLMNNGLEDHGNGPLTLAFTKSHWGEWYFPKKSKPEFSEDGYRKVYVGDTSDIHVAHRPGGIWR